MGVERRGGASGREDLAARSIGGIDAPWRNARKFQRNPIYTTPDSTFSGLYNSVADNTGLSSFV